MDLSEKPPRANPYAKANILSKIFFAWILPLFWKGFKNDLELEDMYDPLPGDLSRKLGDDLEQEWNHQLKLQVKNKKPSMASALWGVLGWDYIVMLLGLCFTELIFRVAQSLVLRELLLTFDGSGSSQEKYIKAGAVSLVTFGLGLTFHPTANYANIISMRARTACSAVIYRKALRLSKAAQGKTTVGQITNILSNDVNRFDMNILHSTYLFMAPIQMILLSVFIWREFGVACLTGIGIVLFFIPLQYWNGIYSAKCRLQIAQRTDERGRILNEIIVGMRIIKQYAWEKPFSSVIQGLRELEVKVLKKRLHLRGFYLSMYMSILKLIIFVTITTYVLQRNQPTADKVFFLVLCYFSMIQSVIYMIPSAISGIGEIKVSCERMEAFLLLEEKNSENRQVIGEKSTNKVQVVMESVTATWSGEKNNLNGVSLDLEGDKIVVIVGAVGSGKSSILHVLLGEFPVASGKCKVSGDISYAAQESWIFAGNVRQNILFGRDYDELKYKQVVTASALEDDFKQFEFGDQTIVGERGISLSGGQKARVNLARCLYQNADIYLLDDPLSAVDTRVSRHLFEKCIKEHLRGKLRILVTHQLQYLPQADHIIVLENGSIVAQGSYVELVNAGVDFVNLMSGDDEDAPSRKGSVIPESTQIVVQDTIDKIRLEERKEEKTEKKVTGSLGSAVYWEYFKSAESPFTFILVLSFFTVCQIALNSTDYWLSYWTTAEANKIEGTDGDYWGRNNYIYVFAGLVAAVIAFNLLRAIGFFTYSSHISVNLHNKMFTSLVRAPAKFFDDNPSGRVMNRFTKDLGSMDELLPPTFFDMLTIFSNVIGVFVIIIITNYYAIIPTGVLLVVLVTFQRYYVCTARAIKRIEGITKSPIFTHSSATFQGLTTIRSAKAQEILIRQFDKLQDTHTSSWFLFMSANRCFGMWVEMVCVIFMAVVIFGLLLLQEATDTGNLGLVITSAMSITGWFQFGMRQASEVENLMTAVERNLEYAKLEPEAPLESKPDKKPPKGWPTKGALQLKNVYLAYEEKDVLKDLTFEIKAQEKIGVVGRTGAGKSSIIQALFRLTEPRGEILIDEIPIKDIGLHDVRKNISIIPQDPVLFSGTMRYNLDPFNDFPDEDLWAALEQVELKQAVPALDYHVTDGGGNFSLGQRQLVCLARAILRKNRIIVMDEATANVDPQTDNLIQATIRSKFADCTIITVAHRLNSVIDCDRILVLDKGTLMEYDHPHNLLQNPHGILTTMVQHTGKSSSALLRKIASETFSKQRPSYHRDSIPQLQTLNDKIENRD